MAPSRLQQPISGGLGMHFSSPVKPRDKKKTNTIVEVPGHDVKRRRLLEKLQELQKPAVTQAHTEIVAVSAPEQDTLEASTMTPPDDDIDIFGPPENPAPDATSQKTKKRLLPDASAIHLFDAWKEVLPTLIEPFLRFLARTVGSVPPPVVGLEPICKGTCIKKSYRILCLFFDHFKSLDVTGCACQTIHQVLIENGLFAMAPTQPRVAVSVGLLDLYRALFEQSCDAVNAFATALQKFYKVRGFRILDQKGASIRDPFRRSLGGAIQWYDCLRNSLSIRVDDALQEADQKIIAYREQGQQSIASAAQEPARLLQQRCPACFGGTTFGNPLDRGADVHVALDGNFHHRHQRNAGDSPYFYEPQYILSKEAVDNVGKRIEMVRKSQPQVYQRRVPDEAVDDCERTYEAADGRKQKTSTEQFDDTGVMALVCRHDIPLFLANIDTAGEQQKYSIALLEHLFSLLPPNTTVAALYDVGCVLDRSLHLYNILDESIMSRLTFCTSAMHAYGHQWACQLVYNPRFRQGIGLSDGEGVERLWSRMRKLIGVERSSARFRRLWLLDRQASAIGEDLKDDLGYWIQRRLRRGVVVQSNKAEGVIKDCGVSIADLECEWEHQRTAQLSIRSHAPARLKKELDVVLDLQNEMDTVNDAIQAARSAIRSAGASAEINEALESLERTHHRLVTKVDQLYGSLNVTDHFPELRGVDFEFVQTLLLARDLKINIRKRAIGSFFEWERLDQAVGGKAQPLGTKLHQQTRKAIAKRKPALQTAIRKFNKYCERLRELHNAEWPIPLPQSLPTDLSSLRDCADLMEDVWITPTKRDIPRWLDDPDVREGIRAMVKRDRCLEERRRLGMEADNLCRWFGRELAAVELALQTPSCQSLYVLLHQHLERLLLLKESWTNQFVSSIRFDTHTANATHIVQLMTGGSAPLPITWLTPSVTDPDALGVADPADEDPTDAVGEESQEADILDILSGEAPEEEGITETLDETYPVKITWCVPRDLKVDRTLLEDLDRIHLCTPSEASQTSGTRVLHLRTGKRKTFSVRDLAILKSPTAWLNDICINGGAALMQHLIHSTESDSCAILSSFVLPSLRNQQNDEQIWQKTSSTTYWTKKIWILPIHRPDHWVLGVIYPHSRRLLVFDSLAARNPWRTEISELLSLVARLTIIANHKQHPLEIIMEDWTVSPMLVTPLQTNTYDCGLWVLASIAAVLRGQHVTGLSEKDIKTFRRRLYHWVASLPCCT